MKKTRKFLSTFLVLTMLIAVLMPTSVQAATKYEHSYVNSVSTYAYSAEDAMYHEAGGKYFGVYKKNEDVKCIGYKNSENGKPKTLYEMPKGYEVDSLLTDGETAYFFIYKYDNSKKTSKLCKYSFGTGKTKVLKTINGKGSVLDSPDILNYYNGKVYFSLPNDDNEFGTAINMLKYFDVKKNVIKTAKKGIEPLEHTEAGQGRYIYIKNAKGNELQKYDCKTDKVVATIGCPSTSRIDIADKNIYLNYTSYYCDVVKVIREIDLDLKDAKLIGVIDRDLGDGRLNSDKDALYFGMREVYNYEKEFIKKQLLFADSSDEIDEIMEAYGLKCVTFDLNTKTITEGVNFVEYLVFLLS